MRDNKKKRIYRQTDIKQQIIDQTTGEIITEQESHTDEGYIDGEPDYIKLYLDTILTFKGISKSLNPVLISLCKHMSYANKDQIVYVNQYTKSCIAEDTGLKIKRIEQAIKQFREVGILKPVSRGVYRVNPYIIGRGIWPDIKRLRATFDFTTGEITDINVDTEQQIQLQIESSQIDSQSVDKDKAV